MMSVHNPMFLHLAYMQRLLLIEALRETNINDVSILTAYEYGKSSLAVWKDEPVLVNKYMQTNRAGLINFNIERYIEVLNYIAKGLCEVEPDEYTYLPLTPTDVDVLNNTFSNAARWLYSTNKYTYCVDINNIFYNIKNSFRNNNVKLFIRKLIQHTGY